MYFYLNVFFLIIFFVRVYSNFVIMIGMGAS